MTTRVVVIGAGISGLALAWYLKSKAEGSIDLKIIEKSDRSGGWIRTDHIEGFLFEGGPRSCRTRGAGRETLALVEALGLQDEVIVASPSANLRYVYLDNELQPFPNSLYSFLKSPLMKGAFAALGRDLWQPKGGEEDESIRSFFSRRIGVGLTNRLIDPLVSGIYAGDIGALSVRSCFPEFYRFEKDYGSLIRGAMSRKGKSEGGSLFVESMSKHPIFSFRGGMESLVNALESVLGSHMRYSTEVKELRNKDQSVEIVFGDGSLYHADKVFLAVPPLAASKLVEASSPDAAKAMMGVPSASVAVVNFGWKGKVLVKEGFGYLIPQSEREEVLGVVWDSSAFPQQNGWPEQTRLTVMLGGCHHPKIAAYPPAKVRDMAREAVRRHLGIDVAEDVSKVSIAQNAIPQYIVGHGDRLVTIEKALAKSFGERLSILGSAWRGVSVNDCIADAKRLSQEH